jgi:hypothetical protein
MLECVDDKVPFAEFMLTQGFDPERFIEETKDRLEEYTCPDAAIDVIEWLAGRIDAIASQRPEIYRDLIGSTLSNWAIDDEEQMEVVERLVGLGATLDEGIVEAMDDLMANCGDPAYLVDVFEWLAERNAMYVDQKYKIFKEWILLVLGNTLVDGGRCVELVERLVRQGAAVDDEVIQACRETFPDNQDLQEFLHCNSVPDCKEPEC